jgi:CheY-like chemotaxis protein
MREPTPTPPPECWYQDDAAISGPPRALVADDDDDIRELVSAALRADGFDVVEARDGTEMLKMLDAWAQHTVDTKPADIVITDVRMPGVSGIEALARLRNGHWHIPVVIMTAYGNAELREEADRLGADVVFDKPFDIDELRVGVSSLLAGDEWSRSSRWPEVPKA